MRTCGWVRETMDEGHGWQGWMDDVGVEVDQAMHDGLEVRIVNMGRDR